MLALVLSMALAAVALAGCGGTHKKRTSTRTGSSTHTTAVASKPIATALDTVPDSSGPTQFRISLYDLRRSGSFLVLDFGATCVSPANSCSVVTAFSPGYEPTKTSIEFDGFTPAGVNLVDPANLKKYLAVRDAEGRPFVSKFSEGDAGLQDSSVHLQWVRYPLPPPGVASLDVAFPNGGPVIRDVPITTGNGPVAGGQVQSEPAAPFAQAPTSTNTSGLTLPVQNLIATTGNATGSDNESPGQAQISLHSDVLFPFNKSSLTPQAKGVLGSVAQQVKARAKGTVQVVGYTDSVGSDAVNIPLSQARAASVVAALRPLTAGISYAVSGKGSADPVAPNAKPDGSDNPSGRALNRRVTITFPATPIRPVAPAGGAAGASGGPSGQGSAMSFTVTSTGGNDTYHVDGASLYRDGNLTLLNMTIACSDGGGNDCFPTGELAGFPTVPPQQLFGTRSTNLDPPAQRSISGFYLLDPATGAASIPVISADQVPLTSSINTLSVRSGDTYQVWAYFPSVSASSLTLISPGSAGRIGGIPVSGS